MKTNDSLLDRDRRFLTRRGFLRRSSLALAAASIPLRLVPAAQAQSGGAIRAGVIGCGGRGTGAAGDILKADPTARIVALADLFDDRLQLCRQELRRLGAEVPDPHCFTGFDAYRRVCEMDEVNYVVLATSPHFRPLHLRAAIDGRKHAFIEKPVAVDAPGVRSVIESGARAKEKGLTIVAGTQRRHQQDYQETLRRLHDGAIGELLAGRAYFNTGTLWHRGRKADWTEMEYQCRNWYYYTWLSGDHIVEQHIHNLDLMNWLFKSHPVRASGNGGRQVRTDPKFGNIYDHFAVEYEYPGGARVFSYCRQTDGCEGNVSDGVVATRGTSNCRNLIQVKGEKPWRFSDPVPPGQVQEHRDMIESIREQHGLNEAQTVAESTLTAILGREAAYSGLAIEWEAAFKSDRKLEPKEYTLEAAPPESAVAIPGRYKFA